MTSLRKRKQVQYGEHLRRGFEVLGFMTSRRMQVQYGEHLRRGFKVLGCLLSPAVHD